MSNTFVNVDFKTTPLKTETLIEMTEILLTYRHELLIPQKCMQGEVNLGIASLKVRHKLKILNEKIARIDRVLKEVNL